MMPTITQINEQIQQAAVYATDRDHLKALLEAEPHAPEKPAPVYVPTTEKNPLVSQSHKTLSMATLITFIKKLKRKLPSKKV